MSTYVLIHGAWHGGWCWYKTAPPLERAGHEVVVFDLPAHGIDGTPAGGVTLHDQVDQVVRMLDKLDGRVILVGHSSGGAIITQAAEQRPEAIEALVYLSAFLPPDGTSVMELAQGDQRSVVLRNLVPDEAAGTATVRPEALEEAFYHDCPPTDVRLARSLLRPEPLGTLGMPVATTEERFGSVPRVYVECSGDHAITPELQRRMHTDVPCDEVLSLDTGHSPFFAAPEALADRLSRV